MWSLFPPALCPQPNLILLRGFRVLTTVLFYMIHYCSSRIVEFNTGYDAEPSVIDYRSGQTADLSQRTLEITFITFQLEDDVRSLFCW